MANNKRLAKNTVVLYFRMIVVTLIGLYTSRIVLKSLGIEDFGTYNVVGGVVALFAFLKSSMSSSTQRFLSFEMGKGNEDNLRNTFNICFFSHVLIVLVLLVLAETIGLWFLNTHINIPAGREFAANWIYQFSVVSLCMGIVSIPYSADIISNEKMGFFAFLGILDSVLKFVIACLISVSPVDKLVFYGFLMMFISFVDLFLNWIYCRIHFKESRYRYYWDKEEFKKVFSFSSWTIWGQLAVVGTNQGTNILVNIFYSVAANAAMGVGMQVNNSITGLVSNFQTAFKPQITKSYSEGDYKSLNSLIILTSKISFFLLFLVSFPVMLNSDALLSLWLAKVPEYAPELCVIFLLSKLPTTLTTPLQTLINATGRIKKMQIAISFSFLLELVLMYLLLKCNVYFTVCMLLKIFANCLILYLSIRYAKNQVPEFCVNDYLKKVIYPFSMLLAVSVVVLIFVKIKDSTLGLNVIITLLSETVLILLCYFYGLSKNEKLSLKKVISKRKKK